MRLYNANANSYNAKDREKRVRTHNGREKEGKTFEKIFANCVETQKGIPLSLGQVSAASSLK